MDQRRVVIDLCSESESEPDALTSPPKPAPTPRPRSSQPRSQPRSQPSVPESRLITPSDDDSETGLQVVWIAREQKEDANTKSLKATGTHTTRHKPPRPEPPAETNREPPTEVSGNQSSRAKRPPQSRAPPDSLGHDTYPHDAPKRPTPLRPVKQLAQPNLPAPLPSGRPVARADGHKPTTRANRAQPGAPSARAQPGAPSARAEPVAPSARAQPGAPSARAEPGTPSNPVMPNTKPVSILSPATQQWLAASQARGSPRPTPPGASVPSKAHKSPLASSAASRVPSPPSSSSAAAALEPNASQPGPSAHSFPPKAPSLPFSTSDVPMPHPVPVPGSNAPKSAASALSAALRPASSSVLGAHPEMAPVAVTHASPSPTVAANRAQSTARPKEASTRPPLQTEDVKSTQHAAPLAPQTFTSAPPLSSEAASQSYREAVSPHVIASASQRPGAVASPTNRALESPRSSALAAAQRYRQQAKDDPSKLRSRSRSRISSADTFVTAVSQSSRDSLDRVVQSERASKRKAEPASVNRQTTKRPRLQTLQERLIGRSNPPTPDGSSVEPHNTPYISIEDDTVVDVIDADIGGSDAGRPRFHFPDDVSQIGPFPYARGKPFGDREDALIVYLKESKKLVWKEFEKYFPGRKWTSLQSRYSNNLSARALQLKKGDAPPIRTSMPDVQPPVARQLRQHRPTFYARDTDVMRIESPLDDQFTPPRASTSPVSEPPLPHTSIRTAPALACLVRHRELGATRGREWPRKFQSQIKDYAYSTIGLEAFMDNASGDVSTIAWSPSGAMFAAGAVAVTDRQSQQYNKPRNMVVGDPATYEIQELDDHRIVNPPAKDLFSTVQMVQFSPDSRHLYSASIDQHLNVYSLDGSVSKTQLDARIEHPASVDFLSVSNDGVVATGCAHAGPGAIRVMSSPSDRLSTSAYFGAANAMPSAKKTPSALRWGTAAHHQHYLLAAFSCEAEVVYQEDDHREKEGELCLWDVRKEQRLETGAPNRNVFDVTWNPNPSPASSVFAVASRVVGKVNSGIHSVVRLYSPDQHRVRHVLELECPAWDINDVLYSPHDENIVAVGSTDGKVFIWDIRHVKKDQLPARILKHDHSLSVLPLGKKRWESDTGIRFLSWGDQRDRVYTGSSDGVVKCWNPYRNDQEMHVRDVARFNSAIMSGAFSPDHCSLLIGEDQARLNLLTVGNADKTRRDMRRFAVHEASTPEEPKSVERPLHKVLLDTGRIEFRPMGTLPIRQAVQGPAYDGPFLTDPDKDALHDKAQRFQEKALRMLQRQKKRLRKTGQTATTRQCHLDCAFKPIKTHDNDGPMEESGRANDRIPENLRRSIQPGLGAQMRGLNAKCKQCGGAARVPDDGGAPAGVLCERCNFACFRCGQAAEVSPRTRALECLRCGVVWDIGALGYEVLREVKGGGGEADTDTAKAKRNSHDDTEGRGPDEELGEEERDFFLRDDLSDDDGSAEGVVAGRVRPSVRP